MTKSTLTNEKLRAIIADADKDFDVGGKQSDILTEMARELLAAREAQSKHPDLYLYQVHRGGEILYSECGKDFPRGRGYYTAPQVPAPQSDHLKRAINLVAKMEELAVRIRAEETLSSAPVIPVSFDDLADAVKEVTGGIRMQFSAETCKGHQAVPFMNFNSLSRIVEMFRTATPVPAVPDKMTYDDAVLFILNNNMCSETREAIAMRAHNAYRAAMLNHSEDKLGMVEPVSHGYTLPEGYKLVPVEPTQEMIDAAMMCDDVEFNSDETFCINHHNIYRAMLAAAPDDIDRFADQVCGNK
ncbi:MULTISPECIES: hypothetical protein [unclassified Serratia (in: enterobacteria)]|uniref:hypothetical protein n=1 Tax=unclassified Serratia (in: enterobacteria) TaxID=2647522 RepID=UPI00068D585B|nr:MULTISPECIES: hypothetical protein [unclassified Serratia (in: enterobacteria)]